MYEPGALIQAFQCEITLDDKVLLKDSTNKEYILSGTYDPRTEKRRIDEKISNHAGYYVVLIESSSTGFPSVLGHDQNYLEHLRNILLTDDTQKVPAAQYIELWGKRWREGATHWDKVHCIPALLDNPLPSSFKWAQAVYLKGSTPWVMPAIYPSLAETINAKSTFIFSAQTSFAPKNYYNSGAKNRLFKEASNISPCCYAPLHGFPKSFTGEISGANCSNKNIMIVLHGFLHPDLAHYKFIKHTINDIEESAIWENLLPVSSNQYVKSTIDRVCKMGHEGVQWENQEIAKCQCESPEIFNKVDSDNGFSAAFSEYLNQIVTFLPNANTVKIWTASFGNLCYLRCNGLRKYDLNGDSFELRLSTWGICHNWDDDNPILHLFVRTFHKSNNSLWGRDDFKFRNSPPLMMKYESFALNSITVQRQ